MYVCTYVRTYVCTCVYLQPCRSCVKDDGASSRPCRQPQGPFGPQRAANSVGIGRWRRPQNAPQLYADACAQVSYSLRPDFIVSETNFVFYAVLQAHPNTPFTPFH